MDEDIPDLPEPEAEAAAEEILGLPRLSPAEGIARCERRIEHLQNEIKEYMDACRKFPNQTEGYMLEAGKLRRQIEENKTMIEHYKLQQQARN